MIDDLVTKGVDEPYRMFTSRAEYRLVLREDNADIRLGEIGYRTGLLNEKMYERFYNKKKSISDELHRLENIKIMPSPGVNNILVGTRLLSPQKAAVAQGNFEKTRDIVQRARLDRRRRDTRLRPGEDYVTQIEMEVKYEGYIRMQVEQIDKFKKLENMPIPGDFSYHGIPGLSKEIVQKLSNVRPGSLGQASRISGMTPAAISVIMVYLKKGEFEREAGPHSFSS